MRRFWTCIVEQISNRMFKCGWDTCSRCRNNLDFRDSLSVDVVLLGYNFFVQWNWNWLHYWSVLMHLVYPIIFKNCITLINLFKCMKNEFDGVLDFLFLCVVTRGMTFPPEGGALFNPASSATAPLLLSNTHLKLWRIQIQNRR